MTDGTVYVIMVTTVHNFGEVSSKQEQRPKDFNKNCQDGENIIPTFKNITTLLRFCMVYFPKEISHTHLTDMLIPLGNKLLL